MALRALIATALAGAALAAQAELPRELLLLARIKQHVREGLAHLPNYTCLETVQRDSRPRRARDFQHLDTVRLEVAVADGKEMFSSPGASQFADQNVEDFVGGGLIGSGMFAMQWKSVFSGDFATFSYVGEEDLAGRRAVSYRYHMTELTSGFHLSNGTMDIVVACHGSFWVDPSMLDLMRIDAFAENIPPELNMAEVFMGIDYGPVRIGVSRVVLAQAAELIVKRWNGTVDRNRLEFTHCRQYGSESQISFGAPAAPVARAEPAAREVALPAGLLVPVELQTVIDSKNAAVGDLLEARVAENVKSKGRVLMPAGARVTGRIRRLEHYSTPEPFFSIGLEFTQAEWQGARANFYGELRQMAPLEGFSWLMTFSKSRTIQVAGPGNIYTSTSERTVTRPLPGVGTFFIRGTRFELPRGLRMVWKTRLP